MSVRDADRTIPTSLLRPAATPARSPHGHARRAPPDPGGKRRTRGVGTPIQRPRWRAVPPAIVKPDSLLSLTRAQGRRGSPPRPAQAFTHRPERPAGRRGAPTPGPRAGLGPRDAAGSPRPPGRRLRPRPSDARPCVGEPRPSVAADCPPWARLSRDPTRPLQNPRSVDR